MTALDWIIVVLYILLITFFSYLIGRKQQNQEDYYLGGRGIPGWQVGASLMANQVSAISLIGAPAFIALKAGGGLKWLQYELAVPLAMIFIIVFLVPVFRRTGGITIYEYLERRFGYKTRALLGLIFLISRSMATGVALLTTSIVTSVCIGLNLPETIVIIGIVSLVYTALGGIKADIYSDIVQLFILWAGSLVCIFILLNHLDWNPFSAACESRLLIFDMRSTGLGDGKTFSFWPMLFGGLFLYISYYGCDQSQAQRLLATGSGREARKALLINGIFRFPLVMTYCAIGVLIIPFLVKFPELAKDLKGMKPDYLMPLFFTRYVPAGLLGIIVAGIFAASMSSLDSAINSLSASTWNDFMIKLRPGLSQIPDRKKVYYSRILTVFWGIVTTLFAIYMSGGMETVIELVNKIGSAFYGPVAAVFALGILVRRADQRSAVSGLAVGTAVNIMLWLFFERQVSWMWWNLIGFTAAAVTGIAVSLFNERRDEVKEFSGMMEYVKKAHRDWVYLFCWFIFIIAFCVFLECVLV